MKENITEEKVKKKIKLLSIFKINKVFIYIGCLVILIAFISIVFLPKLLNPQGGTVSTISESSLEKVIEINDLSTLDYTYNSITEVYDESGEKVKYYVAYEGLVTVGIDITRIDISTDEDEKKIIIKLPETVVQDTSVDMGTLDYIFENDKYETETISQEAYKACIEDLENKAKKEDTLRSMAKDSAVAAVNGLIAPWVKQIDEEYTIEIK